MSGLSGELATTNLLLGIMAVVSILEGLVIIGMAVAGFRAYHKLMALVDGIETRQMQVASAMARVNAILDDVKIVTATVRAETERVDHAIHATMDRIDETTNRIRSNVRAKTSVVVRFVRGLPFVIAGVLRSRHQLRNT
jgi:hypothetical protein